MGASSRRGSTEEAPGSPPKNKDPLAASASASASAAMQAGTKTKSLLDYSVYMTSLVPPPGAGPVTASSPLLSPQNSPEATKKVAGAAQSAAVRTGSSDLVPPLIWYLL